MAQVDFTTAHIQPYGNNPIKGYNDVGWDNTLFLYDVNGNQISTSAVSKSVLENTSTKLLYQVSGTFSASGTEFYVGVSPTYFLYRIYNISFSNGDTFSFRFDARLIV